MMKHLTILTATAALLSVPAHAQSDKIAEGKAVFQKWCVICHGDGPYMAGTQKLTANYEGEKPALLEKRTDLTPEIVKTFVRHGNGVMPRFRKSEVDDEALDAVAAYLSRNNPDLK